MSFIDPDLRDEWRKRDEANRERCRKAGHHVFVGSGDRCVACSAVNPESLKPRVTLVIDGFRAVHDPAKSTVVIERRSVDAVGAERWEQASRLVSATEKEASEHERLIYLFFTKGRAP